MRLRSPALLAIAIGAAAIFSGCEKESEAARNAAPPPPPPPQNLAEEMQLEYPPFLQTWVTNQKARGVFLVLPPTDANAAIVPALESLSAAATYQFVLLLPADIGIVSNARVRSASEDFFPRNESGHGVFSVEKPAELADVYGATHTIVLRNSAPGTVTAEMTTPTGTKTTTIPADPERNLAFAQALTSWALTESGVTTTPEETARFATPLFAGATDRWPLAEQGDALAAKIEQLVGNPGPKDPATLVEATALYRTRPGSVDEAKARTLVSTPGGPGLAAYEYIARANLWFALRFPQAGVRESRAGFAVHKHNWHLVDLATNLNAQVGVDEYEMNFVRSTVGTYAALNAATAVQFDSLLWNAQLNLPASIPLRTPDAQPTELDANAEYAAIQIEQVLPSFKLRPLGISTAIYAYGVGGRPEQVEPLFRSAIAAYPGALSVWRARIEVETPLYRGDAAKLASLLAEVEAATAKDPLLGCLPYHAAAASAKAEFAGARDAIARWRQAHPAEWQKVRAGLNRYATVGPHYESRAKNWLAAAGE